MDTSNSLKFLPYKRPTTCRGCGQSIHGPNLDVNFIGAWYPVRLCYDCARCTGGCGLNINQGARFEKSQQRYELVCNKCKEKRERKAKEEAKRRASETAHSSNLHCCTRTTVNCAQKPSSSESESSNSKSSKSKECSICLGEFAVGEGLFCDKRTDFRCLGCIHDHIEEKLQAGGDVRVNGSLECKKDCGGFFSLEEMRLHLPAETFKQWNTAQFKSREKALAKQYEEQLTNLRHQLMDTVKRHVKHCQEVIFNTLCPRCHVAIQYEGDCLAMKCNNCMCGFCSFCMEDQGDDAHTHCAGCKYNSLNHAIFPTKGREREVFAQIQQARIQRQLREYLEKLHPDTAVQVREALKKLTSNIL